MKTTLSPQLILIWNWLKEKAVKLWNWLQEAATNVWRFLLGILLLIIGLWLLPLVTIAAIGFYFAFIRSKKQNVGEILRSQGTTYKLIAIGIDILGNIIGGPFFNWLLLKKQLQFPFGIPGEKMSTVIALNFKLDNLSEWGLNLRHDLDIIEFDHCDKSLAADLFTTRHFIEKYKAILAQIEKIERTKEFLAKYN